MVLWLSFFFFQAEDGIRDLTVTGVQTCALPISDHCDGGLQQRLAHAVGRLAARAGRGCGHGRKKPTGRYDCSAGFALRCAATAGKRPAAWTQSPIRAKRGCGPCSPGTCSMNMRSEEHTSELQSQSNLVCRLLLEKKK